MSRARAWFAGTALGVLVIMYLRVPYTPLGVEPPIAILALFGPFLLPVAIYYLAVRGRRWTIGVGVILAVFVTLPWALLGLGVEPPRVFMAVGLLCAWVSVLLGSAYTGYRALARRFGKMDVAGQSVRSNIRRDF